MHALFAIASLLLLGSPRHYLFVDRSIIAEMRGTVLHLHSPVPREVSLRFDAPWEGEESGYVTVLKDHRANTACTTAAAGS